MSLLQTPSTPDSGVAFGDEAYEIIEEVVEIHTKLASISDFTPNPWVNDLFSRLVRLCLAPRSTKIISAVLDDVKIRDITPHLQRLCSEGECHLELFWADRILQHSYHGPAAVKAMMQSFPYFRNYVALTRLESAVLLANSSTPFDRIAFIGSGPLPLTSFCLAELFPSLNIHNVDHDDDAVQRSSGLASSLGLKDRLSFQCEPATASSDLNSFDVVYLAALVGTSTTEKRYVLQNVVRRMKIGALVCVRSAHSLRGLMYPVFDLSEDLQNVGLEQLVVVHPMNDIVNSILVARVIN